MGFEKCLEVTLDIEKGYSNHSWDNGGETNFGITKASYPDLDIKELTLEDAKVIYYKDYWLSCSCDEMPLPLALHVFDLAVNSGQVYSKKVLQKALNVKDDGIIGPKTIEAINLCEDIGLVTDDIASERLELMINHEDWQIAKKGWKRRVNRISRRAGELQNY